MKKSKEQYTEELRKLSELDIKEEVLEANKKRILNNLDKKENVRHIRFIPVFATVVLVVFSLLATTVLAFPGVAAKAVPGIPLVKEMEQNKEQVDALSAEVETFKESEQIKENEIKELKAQDQIKEEKIEDLEAEVEELKIKIKEISDELIKEVETSPNEDEAQNLQLQNLVVDFVKEMYKGNYEEAAKYCTEDFAKTVINDPDDVIMRTGSTSVVFTQITNVAKVDDAIFIVFLRLNDSGEEMEADYQLDFEIQKTGDEYRISFVGIDA